jgi:hypothetical protein
MLLLRWRQAVTAHGSMDLTLMIQLPRGGGSLGAGVSPIRTAIVQLERGISGSLAAVGAGAGARAGGRRYSGEGPEIEFGSQPAASAGSLSQYFGSGGQVCPGSNLVHSGPPRRRAGGNRSIDGCKP